MKLLRLFSALFLALGAAVASPSAAFAHDEPVSTSPSLNQVVPAGAFDVSITFGEDIMNLNNGKGLAIQVFAPGLKYLSKDCIRVSGKTMSTRIDADVAGKYQVAWQSVSSDGHSNTGVFQFTVENKNGYKASAIHVCENVKPVSSAKPTPTANLSNGNGVQTAIQTILFILIVVGGSGFFVRRYLQRRKK